MHRSRYTHRDECRTVLTFIDTVDWTNFNATRVVRIDTWLSDNVGHGFTRLSYFIPVMKAAKD